ncbi:MAG: fluoride efflux transporter CrcB [Acidimicrobiales bacterium]
MTVGLFLSVAAGGLVGAPSRFLLDRSITARLDSELPWGTFVVNASGCLLLGLLTGFSMNGHLSPAGISLLGTGFCGAFTTFSTFSFESVRLVEDGQILEAVGTVVVSVVVGLAVAAAGLAVGLAI